MVSKNAEKKRLYLMDAARDWHPSVRLLLQSTTHELLACVPVLSSTPVVGTWPSNGDLAHPMSPTGGAGADTAIRDAVDLCKVVTTSSNPQKIASFGERKGRAEDHSFI